MPKEIADLEVQEAILRCLRDFYPVKGDMDVVISTVQRNGSGASAEQIAENFDYLRDHGWIEQTVLKAPAGGPDTYRLKIAPPGIEHLRCVEKRGIRDLSIALTQVKEQAAAGCEQLRSEVERLGRELEESKKDILEMRALIETFAGKAEAERAGEERLLLRVLSGDEKTVYHAILNSGGEMLQKELVVRVRMSNAKVSRVVDRLESRGVLAKERWGATNRLRITVGRS